MKSNIKGLRATNGAGTRLTELHGLLGERLIVDSSDAAFRAGLWVPRALTGEACAAW
ncbi:MAG: hypothetical protein ACPGZP_09865 [Panacagrimonas sp.]